jgi:hypothetical protein
MLKFFGPQYIDPDIKVQKRIKESLYTPSILDQ